MLLWAMSLTSYFLPSHQHIIHTTMKKLVYVLSLTLGIFLFLTSCKSDSPDIKMVEGKGPAIDSLIAINGFAHIQVKGSPTVYLYQGNTFEVRLSGSKNLLPLVNVYWRTPFLVIETPEDVMIRNNNLELHVQLPVLMGVENIGTGLVESKTDFTCESLIALTNNTGELRLTGKTKSLTASMYATGTLHLEQMQAEKVTVDISGKGTAKVNAEKTLYGWLDGSGKVLYKGNPRVGVEITGTGTVLPF
ncbi:hypothetical protein GBK04_10015 [Cytophagaceae bacterium SJW1-29]|uniref:Putative auto-transporter adhesin head GIN domain-containing protein n=2 Tax=Salmonirosea aquatica TaxID=2654236 RepID=A0A7C9BIE1_9BACT|nr:hypothetical protein [Cytophagaceae bacterium SJW1-29]